MDAQTLIGMAVVSLDDADRLGTVDEAVFQTDPLRLIALQVADPRGRFVVLVERIRSIGADAVTVETREVADAGVLATGVDGRVSLTDLRDLKVVDETGAHIGDVQSIDVEPADGTVTGVNINKGGVMGIGAEKTTIPPDAIRGIGGRVLTIKAEAEPEPADEATPFT